MLQKVDSCTSRSHRGYFMEDGATIGVILYWQPNQPFFIHIAHHVWFDEYSSCISIEYNHSLGSLQLQQYPEINFHNQDLLNLIPCELDIKSTVFLDTKIITYENQLPLSGRKVGFDLLNDKDFTIQYITDTIKKS